MTPEEALARVVHLQAELAGENDLLALRPENSSEFLLRAAAVAVAVGGVDQVDAAIDRRVHDPLRRLEIDAAAEIIAAEPDDGDFKRGGSELTFLHRHGSLRSRQSQNLPCFVGRGDLAAEPAGDADHALDQEELRAVMHLVFLDAEQHLEA